MVLPSALESKISGRKATKQMAANLHFSSITNKGAPSKVFSHLTYFQMINDIILALKERAGSSSQAIAKYMEEHHKANLPGNFKKLLGNQLKNSIAKGKLIKIKASYKLCDAAKKEKSPKPTAGKKPKAPKVAKATDKKPKATKATEKKLKKADSSQKKKATTTKPAQKAPVKKAIVKKDPVKNAGKSIPTKRKAPKSIKYSTAKKAKKA